MIGVFHPMGGAQLQEGEKVLRKVLRYRDPLRPGHLVAQLQSSGALAMCWMIFDMAQTMPAPYPGLKRNAFQMSWMPLCPHQR
ncbi:MAG: hypothetical protein C0514_08120 [Candidatus Puniceispirillum sp.]|nr:hypothetical protein [Candidatus Puniceispirillum sp.]